MDSTVWALIDARAPFNALLTDVTNIRANRLNASAGQTTITSGGAFGTSSRTTSWSGTVVHVFDVVFANWDKARHFFNSGGQIRLAASRSGGSASSQNTSITNMLSSIGTIIFDHTATTRTGAGGTATSIGFYNLTSSYQTLYSVTGTGVYTSDSYVLSAQLVGTAGATGTIRFRASFSQTADGSVDALPDGTLTSNVDTRRATGVLNVTAPTYTLNTALTSTGGGLPVPTITAFSSITTGSINMTIQDTGSSPLPTSFIVRYRRAGSSSWINGGSVNLSGVPTATSAYYNRAGLASNTAYEFQAAAVSALGTSDYSASAYQATIPSGSNVSFTLTAGQQPSPPGFTFDDTGYANAAFASPGYGSVTLGSVNGKPIYAMWQTGVASSTVAFGSSGGDPASTFFRTIRIRATGTTGTNAERTLYANQTTYSLTPGSYATWSSSASAENSFIMYNGQVYDVTVEY